MSERRWIRPVYGFSLAAVGLLFLRQYQDRPTFISLARYIAGTEAMPFQGRVLMMLPLRLAEHSSRLNAWSRGFTGLNTPAAMALFFINIVSIFVTAYALGKLYTRTSTQKSLPLLPLAVLAWVCQFAYLQAFFYPYDIPALAFFTVGLYFIHSGRFWLLAGLFPIATLNRETTFFLIFLVALNEVVTPAGHIAWGRVFRWRSLLKLALLSVTWLIVELLVHHMFRNNSTETAVRLMKNLRTLRHPQYWPQLLSVGGFCIPMLLLLRNRISDVRIRLYLAVLPLWLGVMLVYSEILEVRVYGELSGLIAIAVTLAMEGALRTGPEAESIRGATPDRVLRSEIDVPSMETSSIETSSKKM